MTKEQKRLLEDKSFMSNLCRMIFHAEKLEQTDSSGFSLKELRQYHKNLAEMKAYLEESRAFLGEVFESAENEVRHNYASYLKDLARDEESEENEKAIDIYQGNPPKAAK